MRQDGDAVLQQCGGTDEHRSSKSSALELETGRSVGGSLGGRSRARGTTASARASRRSTNGASGGARGRGGSNEARGSGSDARDVCGEIDQLTVLLDLNGEQVLATILIIDRIGLPRDSSVIGEDILTNFVTSGVAGVGVELQGRLGIVSALVRDLGFDVLHVGAAQGSQVGGVRRGTRGRKSAFPERDRNVGRGASGRMPIAIAAAYRQNPHTR
jgi:hypothetical protein